MPNAGTAALAAAFEAKKAVQMTGHPTILVAQTQSSSTLPQAVTTVPHDELSKFPHSKRVGQYLLGKTLGEGSFAKVKEGMHVGTGEKVAVKIIDKFKAREDNYVRRNMKREGGILQMVRHPHVVRLLETLETENHYYLIMEFCSGGNIMGKVAGRKGMSEAEVRKYLRQVVSAVDHLHRAGIVHRDLKVENLLLDEDGNIKIIDFGLSNCMRSPRSAESGESYIPNKTSQDVFVTQCGSPAYAAPELLSRKTYGTKVDVWSVGINMFVMLTGVLPFTVEPYNLKELYKKMIKRDINSIPPYLSEECKELLFHLLEPDPSKRPHLESVMEHPWLNKGCMPLIPVHFPNYLKQEDLNQDIVRHMCHIRAYRMGELVKMLLTNKSVSSTAVYHLLVQRLNKYNMDMLKKKRPGFKGTKKSVEDSPRSRKAGTNNAKATKQDWQPIKFPDFSSEKGTRPRDQLTYRLNIVNNGKETKAKDERFPGDADTSAMSRKVKVTVIDRTMPMQLSRPNTQAYSRNQDNRNAPETIAMETKIDRPDMSPVRNGYMARNPTPESASNVSNKENTDAPTLKPVIKDTSVKRESKTAKKRVTISSEKPEVVGTDEKTVQCSVTTITYPLSFRQMYKMNKEQGIDPLNRRNSESKNQVSTPRTDKCASPRISVSEPKNAESKQFVISTGASGRTAVSTRGSSLLASAASSRPSRGLHDIDEGSPVFMSYNPATNRVQVKMEGRPQTNEVRRWEPVIPTVSQTPATPPIKQRKQVVKIKTPTPEPKEPVLLPQLNLPLVGKSGFEPTYPTQEVITPKSKTDD
ncbi:MAP/microtubule affinity-regulating kinase 4-like [Ptychodera flava]|uniref:MAP/microtubule affinity-regulating kinase 4-like n=1 Tax=Ptychodera flava TaxID=63121 RepID=UPI00396A62E9